ncbi:MAG: helix-turn-helix domain-containing protein [Aggregatilineales bacterium]
MIALSDEEREAVEAFIRRGKAKARSVTRAHILLKDADGWSIPELAKTFGVSPTTVGNVRKRYRAGGIGGVLKDKAQAKRRCGLDGTEKVILVAIACSPVPDGHDHWTLRMLRDKLIELEVVEHVSAATIQDRLKKMNLSRGSASTGVYRRKST